MTKLRALLSSWLINYVHLWIDFISIIIHPLSKSWSKSKVRILVYHRVCDLPETKGRKVYPNVLPTDVPLATFAQQMALLSQNGFNVITLEQFIDYKDKDRKPPPKSVVITFDDGYRHHYFTVFPMLEKHNFKGTFFVVADYIGSDEILPWHKRRGQLLSYAQGNKRDCSMLTKQNIIDMSAQDACFGSHTKTHPSLIDIDEGKALDELKGSKEYLEEILLKPVRCFSYPYGHMSKSVKSLVKAAGYEAAVSVKGGGNTLKSDFLALRRTSIRGRESLTKFKRKVEGAYDWWFEYLLPAIMFMQRIVFRK